MYCNPKNSLGFWILDSSYWIPDSLSIELEFQYSRFLELSSRFQGLVSRISQGKISQITDSRSLWKNLADSWITINLLGATYFDNKENWSVAYLSVDHSQILHRQWSNDSPSRLGDVPSRTCNSTGGIYMYTEVCSEEMFRNQWISLADLFSSNSDCVIIEACVRIVQSTQSSTSTSCT